MSGAVDPVAAAEERARIARARLETSAAALRERVDPRTVARNAAEGLREQAEAAAAVARRNPGIVAGTLAVAGLLIARRPVLALFRRRGKDTAGGDTAGGAKHSITHTAREGAKGKPQ
ncbi:hypothetical protein [Sphingomonas sp. NFR15]|uniref:hypothetical protein n=1 Tax=Sphingomonas sp. NFR15 TaxID=1566282 RepID=UPI000889EA16|nr:hypothetical protein [Sphingomonas sp. NFR15]SDA12970.1 hypothetical protein SAMN03159340_00351 [Sphingomonas sp. NFR15]